MRSERLIAYINAARQDHCLPDFVAFNALYVWEAIQKAFPAIDVPDVSFSCPDMILFIWDKEEHHAEVEIRDDIDAYFFYRNRFTRCINASDFTSQWEVGNIQSCLGELSHFCEED